MVGVEFITRCIAPLQDHRREIWRHRARDDLRLHISELNADAREEVIRAFFSSAAVPAIPRTVLPIYNFGRSEGEPRYGGDLEVQRLGPAPCRRCRARSSPERTGSQLGAGLGSEGSGARGLWRS
jgi:hypothetical protein